MPIKHRLILISQRDKTLICAGDVGADHTSTQINVWRLIGFAIVARSVVILLEFAAPGQEQVTRGVNDGSLPPVPGGSARERVVHIVVHQLIR